VVIIDDVDDDDDLGKETSEEMETLGLIDPVFKRPACIMQDHASR
jgi:hypothetical protein